MIGSELAILNDESAIVGNKHLYSISLAVARIEFMVVA